MVTHAHSLGRSIHLFNLDPAAEYFEYEPSIDIRELITLEDVMEEMDLGPNGGLIYCFEYVQPAHLSATCLTTWTGSRTSWAIMITTT